MSFRAVQATKTEAGQSVGFAELEDADLMDGDVTVRVTHSTVNYKDGLALAVDALEEAGLAPEMGPAVVTGAAGGVGSIAIALLAKRGWSVIASTGRAAETAYLKSLGAAEILDRTTLSAAAKPLAKERWI